jgi:hypothetical protein
MNKSRSFLVAGGVISALLAILHVTLALNPELFVYIAPGGDSSISEMAEQGSSLIVAATAVLALIFAAWALYAFSAAGLIRRLPLLRPALVAIAVIYILRSLFLPTEISMLLDQDYPLRFVLFSTLSLVTGLLYLFGALRLARR